jgi:hypothetical protein
MARLDKIILQNGAWPQGKTDDAVKLLQATLEVANAAAAGPERQPPAG